MANSSKISRKLLYMYQELLKDAGYIKCYVQFYSIIAVFSTGPNFVQGLSLIGQMTPITVLGRGLRVGV